VARREQALCALRKSPDATFLETAFAAGCKTGAPAHAQPAEDGAGRLANNSINSVIDLIIISKVSELADFTGGSINPFSISAG
jgi:hypothetical protein